MDYSKSSLISMSPYFCHGKNLEEMGQQSWLYSIVELESLKMQAQEEIRSRDEQLRHVKELLHKVINERDEALHKCQTLHFQTTLLKQQQKHSSLSSPSGDDNSIESYPLPKLQSFQEDVILPGNKHPLPEKGKLLQAVMKAGPLLQTLLLSGPLPQWRHPPPPLNSFEIPPVTINNISIYKICRKRGLISTTSNCSDSFSECHKLQKQDKKPLEPLLVNSTTYT